MKIRVSLKCFVNDCRLLGDITEGETLFLVLGIHRIHRVAANVKIPQVQQILKNSLLQSTLMNIRRVRDLPQWLKMVFTTVKFKFPRAANQNVILQSIYCIITQLCSGCNILPVGYFDNK